MISSYIKMEDRELLKLYKQGETNFIYHRFYNRNSQFIRIGIGTFLERNVPDFSNENLTKIILNNSKLYDANLSGTNLSSASLIDADFSSARLIDANLSGANLSSAILINTDLSGANLSGADLTNACLDGAILKGVIIDNNTKIDKKYYLIWRIFNEELMDRNLSGVDLTGAWLEKANLNKVNLSNGKLHEVCFSNEMDKIYTLDRRLATRLKGANLTEANLENVNLRGADLRDANLTEANLENANLKVADLRDAKLIRVNLRGVDLTEADLRKASLTGANLSGADLRGCRIRGSNFADVDFRNTNLTGTKTQLTGVSTLRGAIYNDETKFPEGFDPKTAQMIHEDDIKTKKYHNSQWIELLTKKKVKTVKSPPPREGQEKFKEELTKKYGYKCLISGCEIKEIIEAAHIIPYRDLNSHDVANGLLLRVDLHRLFDAHLIAIHPTTREVLISEQIAKDYQDIRGIEIESCLTGEDATKQQDALRYHYEQCNWINKRLLE
ncbi:pentapeptide repeat-containing protein [Aphanizomenon flos-aquae NRERC-008]|uniref:Pentapeptide repeat-containing protein n=1 Tax=Aphanizomenon flos-aquae FACHB-1249 TaxID=2692889 RepID=A0ABR8IU08_APHFL|nr:MULTISPECIES: pentapeptide repeat-containing protein [Aphanizomenon]MBD2391999.1 pentapeptide repeat-containing protein [Aphanizomenon flos-aquae FACHB-1171]MBD2557726.1 pentapeptide repeat-containing protein [Aphanizomenon flos-aquae FACHB-1290]MBD2632212.1 pentapeptide repeat-containing protein [Aphanizomenon sp. FACHB-1399]MBD2643122.1 pentapeptide repeat-containing protein [Aphanizomenon sp. FACHB-1401]MBD2658585.1 pentapeptide repeat-containing protein [Aphanizomenon flos-aquae FACHB-1